MLSVKQVPVSTSQESSPVSVAQNPTFPLKQLDPGPIRGESQASFLAEAALSSVRYQSV
jgi:hypothetical protein